MRLRARQSVEGLSMRILTGCKWLLFLVTWIFTKSSSKEPQYIASRLQVRAALSKHADSPIHSRLCVLLGTHKDSNDTNASARSRCKHHGLLKLHDEARLLQQRAMNYHVATGYIKREAVALASSLRTAPLLGLPCESSSTSPSQRNPVTGRDLITLSCLDRN